MKKLISLMLVLVMAFAMVACAQPAATTEEPAAEEGAATEETAAPAEEGKKLKLGFILGSRARLLLLHRGRYQGRRR